MLCIKLHHQKSFELKHISHKICPQEASARKRLDAQASVPRAASERSGENFESFSEILPESQGQNLDNRPEVLLWSKFGHVPPNSMGPWDFLSPPCVTTVGVTNATLP